MSEIKQYLEDKKSFNEVRYEISDNKLKQKAQEIYDFIKKSMNIPMSEFAEKANDIYFELWIEFRNESIHDGTGEEYGSNYQGSESFKELYNEAFDDNLKRVFDNFSKDVYDLIQIDAYGIEVSFQNEDLSANMSYGDNSWELMI